MATSPLAAANDDNTLLRQILWEFQELAQVQHSARIAGANDSNTLLRQILGELQDFNGAGPGIGFALTGAQNTFLRGQIIEGTQDEVQLLIKGDAGQVSELFLIENSAGTDLLSVQADGDLDMHGNQVLNVGAGGVTFASTGAVDTATNLGVPTLAAANTFTRGQVIDGTADENQLRVQLVAGQTVNAIVIEDSTGADLINVQADGDIDLLGNQLLQVGNGGVTFSGTGAADTRATLAVSGTGTANTFTRGQVIDGTVDEIQLRIQAFAGQAANLFVVEGSAGADLFVIEPDGDVNVNGRSILNVGSSGLGFSSGATGGAGTAVGATVIGIGGDSTAGFLGGYGGSISTNGGSASAAATGGYGGSIITGGSPASGATIGGSGGSIDTSGALGFDGGYITTRSGGTAAGGSITTEDGGGSIDTTNNGSIQLGYAGSRTTINGSGADCTITLPTTTGTLFVKNTLGSNNHEIGIGTPYSLTNAFGVINMGTLDPVVTLGDGVYALYGDIVLEYNGATFAAIRTIDFEFYRTNNTPATISSNYPIVRAHVNTTFTGNLAFVKLGPINYTATAGDTVTIRTKISVVPTAGSVDVTSAVMYLEGMQ